MYNAMLVQMHDSRHQLPKYVNGFFNEGDAETHQSRCVMVNAVFTTAANMISILT